MKKASEIFLPAYWKRRRRWCIHPLFKDEKMHGVGISNPISDLFDYGNRNCVPITHFCVQTFWLLSVILQDVYFVSRFLAPETAFYGILDLLNFMVLYKIKETTKENCARNTNEERIYKMQVEN